MKDEAATKKAANWGGDRRVARDRGGEGPKQQARKLLEVICIL